MKPEQPVQITPTIAKYLCERAIGGPTTLSETGRRYERLMKLFVVIDKYFEAGLSEEYLDSELRKLTRKLGSMAARSVVQSSTVK